MKYGRDMELKNWENSWVFHTFLAECVDCGQPRVKSGNGDWFVCGCEEGDLAFEDILCEDDERWSIGHYGVLLHHNLNLPEDNE